jgi:hypothetical protein
VGPRANTVGILAWLQHSAPRLQITPSADADGIVSIASRIPLGNWLHLPSRQSLEREAMQQCNSRPARYRLILRWFLFGNAGPRFHGTHAFTTASVSTG